MESHYASVILPLKLYVDITYEIPPTLLPSIEMGSYVEVPLKNRVEIGVVTEISTKKPNYKGEIKSLLKVLDLPPITPKELELISWMAGYYMCTVGEVFKAASGNFLANRSIGKRERKEREESLQKSAPEIVLTSKQQEVYNACKESFIKKIPLLINGITGSGKTEIYMQLAKEMLNSGRSVLYMVPEVALSKQLTTRIQKQFGSSLMVFHSRTTSLTKKKVREALSDPTKPIIILGLRSSIFLPFKNLGLIIVDEEHDSSYKQSDPAPRYNGRDCALMLARIHNCGVVLGSATPSLETLYNCNKGRFNMALLNERYHSAQETTIEIIDLLRERRRKAVEGLFSNRVLEEIANRLELKEQVLVFRNRRSYSPMVQCIYCGDIPGCESCNVSLNYHKNRERLSCHYCQYSRKFTTICTKCGKPGLKELGYGTERIEEELKRLFPNAVVDRLDSNTTMSIKEEESILRNFATGKTDILVGTQMASKGFDFEKLSLIVLVQADSMLSIDDFRAGEKAMQMLIQLAGRSGRREKKGHIMVQTSQPKNIIYNNFAKGHDATINELEERKLFEYPPFVRFVKISIKHRNRQSLDSFCSLLSKNLSQWGVENFMGPLPPAVEWVKREYILNFWIKLERKSGSDSIKQNIYKGVEPLIKEHGRGITLSFDVDPL